MKRIKFLAGTLMFQVMMFALPSCTNDINEEIDDLRKRVEKLEDLVETLDKKMQNGAMISDITALPAPKSGWLITFTDDREPLEIYHGAQGDPGGIPQIQVKTNPDGTISLWIDGVDTEIDLTGPKGDDGDHAVSPRIEVRPNEGGEGLSVWYNITKGYPDDKWVNTGVNISAPATGSSLWTIIENADGTITLVLNDGTGTEYTFARYSSASHFQIMTSRTVEIAGSGTAPVVFRVNPSTAWIPTGTGEAVAKWAIDEFETTRAANYLNPSKVFKVESILPDGEKKGQYVATISSDFTLHDQSINEYMMALVLNNNSGNLAENDAHISSAPFAMMISTPAIVAEGDTGPLHWVFRQDGSLTFTGEGAMPNYVMFGSPAVPWNSHQGKIKTITFEPGVTAIGNRAFVNTKSLTKVTIPASLTIIGDSAFEGSSIPAIALPDGLESIGKYTFSGSAVADVTIPANVTAIGAQAFRNCKGITEMVVPDAIQTINSAVFQGCSNMTTLTIGSGVTTIASNAFAECGALASVTIKATTPPTLTSDNFAANTEDVLYVPVGTVEAYQAASAWNGAFKTITDGQVDEVRFIYAKLGEDWGRGVFGEGTRNFTLQFSEFDQNGTDQTGYALGVEFVSVPLDETQQTLEIPAGTYTVTSDNPPGVTKVVVGYYSILKTVEAGNVKTQLKITDGAVTIAGGRDSYTITFNLTMDDGTPFRAKYVGPIEIKNLKYPLAIGTLSGISQLDYTADGYKDGSTDVWMLTAYAAPGVYLENGNLKGSGWILRAQINTPLNSGKPLPGGEYLINGTYDPMTVRAGWDNPFQNPNKGGMCVERMDGGKLVETRYLVSGTFTSTLTGGEYKIDIVAKDLNGAPVTLTVKAAAPASAGATTTRF